MRFHLVDRIEEICYGRYAVGVKCVSMADDVFNEHFPGYPVFPGSLITESLAQLGGSFLELMMKEQKLPLRRSILSIINRMKFRKPAVPGDKIMLRADLVAMRDDYGVVKVQAKIDGETCADGEMIFAFVDISLEKVQQSREELYRICTKNMKVVPDEDCV